MELQFDPENPKYEYITNGGRAIEIFKELAKERVLAVDVETTGLDPHLDKLLLLQVGTPEISYIFDAREIDLKNLPIVHEVFENQQIIKLFHNAKFDYKFIRRHIGCETLNIYCTFLAEGVMTAGLGASLGLKDLAAKYLGLTLDKELQKSFIGLTGKIVPAQLVYAGIDTLMLFPIFEQQLVKLNKLDVAKIAKLEFSVCRVVAEMELKGIYIDQDKWRGIIANLDTKRHELAQQFQDMVRPYYKTTQEDLFGNTADAININSNAQLMDLFNNKLGLDMPSTGVAILKTTDHPAVNLLQDYRGYEKLISSFGDTLLAKINPITKRVHPSFMQLGAATGRFACNGPNLQQIPRNTEEAPFRECMNPAPGYDFVVADYSSFEMRILADLSGDENFVNAMNGGLDMHSYTASLMFDLPYDSIKTEHKDKRQAAKAIGFGLMYGMGPMGLAAQIKVEKEEAQQYMNRYFGAYPSVKAFLDGMAENAVKNGWSATPGGRKRWYKQPEKSDPDYNKKLSNIQRQAKNHPIQGTNADAVKYALVFLHERLKKEKVKGDVILTVHDEVVCEVPEDCSHDWSKIQEEEMVRAGELFIKKVPVISDPFVGKVWEH